MMYASKTPRDLNRDPLPYRNIETGRRYADAPAGTDYYFRYEPRPEYDAVQHNEPNPIMGLFREDAPRYASTQVAAQTWKATWGTLCAYHPLFKTGVEAEIEHARKVLSRLAALAENG